MVTTSSGGATNAKQTDWGPLGRFETVWIWPDSDAPGDNYADDVAVIIHKIGVKTILRVDARALGGRSPDGNARECPEGWDVAEAIDEDGWQVKELRRRIETCSSRWAPPEATTEWPSNFNMSSSGLLRKYGENWEEITTRPFTIVGEARNPTGSARGYLLSWLDADAREQRGFVRHAELVGDSFDWLKALVDRGFPGPIDKKKINALKQALHGCRVFSKLTMVSKTGWIDATFVLPHRTIGAQTSECYLFDGAPAVAQYRERGTLADWREHVARFAIGNDLLIFAMSVGFAGPVVDLLEEESFGTNLVGSSSSGKSSALLMAGSIWGGGGPLGFAATWRATDNGIEGIAAAHSGTLLALDEVGQLNPDKASEVAYMLGNGVGKVRAQKSGDARAAREWRVVFLSTGETGLIAKIEEARGSRRAKAGTSVRFIDVPADGGAGLGLFQNCHGKEASAFAQTLKSNSLSYHGTAGPAFVAYLTRCVAEKPLFKMELRKQIEQVRNQLLAAAGSADGQVSRVSHRLAIIAVAGELASEALELGWEKNAPLSAAGKCFANWLERRGGLDAQELLSARRALRRAVEQDECRFQRLNGNDHSVVDVDAAPVRDLLGYYWEEDGERIWAFTTSGLEEILTGVADFKELVRLLVHARVIRRGEDRIQCGKKIRGKKTWLYLVPHSRLHADEV